MLQFERHADAYNRVRQKITYPEKLFQTLTAACRHHEAALDIGCGTGVSTTRLAGYFSRIEGIDQGENLIAKARENYPDLHFFVSPAERFQPERRYDLITSATSFYWMDRPLVLQKMERWLTEAGVFCAYKYDFPIVYGPLRALIEHELANRWSRHRDRRLTDYDDTLELMHASGLFAHAERQIVGNIIALSPRDVALFFLSTSYVTRYIEQEGGESYIDTFLAAVEDTDRSPTVNVNVDIHAFTGWR